MTTEEITERPEPDHRDRLEIGQSGGDDDGSNRRKPKDQHRETEERTLH